MLRRWRGLVHRVIRRSAADRDLDEEIRAHLAIDAEQRMRAGESPTEAWSAARRDLGSVMLAKERTRDEWGISWPDRASQDLRHAMIGLRRSPGFAVLVCIVLALGIGAAAAIFAVVHSVLLRPLAFPEPERLVMIWERPPDSERRNPSASHDVPRLAEAGSRIRDARGVSYAASQSHRAGGADAGHRRSRHCRLLSRAGCSCGHRTYVSAR